MKISSSLPKMICRLL